MDSILRARSAARILLDYMLISGECQINNGRRETYTARLDVVNVRVGVALNVLTTAIRRVSGDSPFETGPQVKVQLAGRFQLTVEKHWR